MDLALSAPRIESLLHSFVRSSGLKLTFKLSLHPGGVPPALSAEFFGEDVVVLLARNAELLVALEHIAAKALRLEPENHDWVSFDAAGFKQQRERSIQRLAAKAVDYVRTTGKPYHLPPMNSRERRLLHLALAQSQLLVASEGEGGRRHVVVRPPPAMSPD